MIHEDKTVLNSKWEKVASGYPFVAVQLKGQGQILVCLKQGPNSASPSATEGTFVEGDGSYFSAGGLPEDIDVYVKSRRDKDETVNVLAY